MPSTNEYPTPRPRAFLLSAVAEALCCSQTFLYDHLDRDTGIIDFGNGVTLRAIKTARWVVPAAELARFLGEPPPNPQ